MSLERTALRLGMVMALTNGFASPYPTIAANRVFDSRIDPVEGLEQRDVAPLIVVYTDSDDGQSLSVNNGGPPFGRKVDLVLELAIGMAGAKTEEGTTPLIRIETEPELEAMLDLLEMQVERVLLHPFAPWAARLSGLFVRIESWNSRRFVEREGQVRMAARQIMAEVLLPQPPEAEIVAVEPEDPSAIPAPLGPLLQAIIDADGPYAPSATALAELLTTHGGFAPLVLPPLERVRFIEQAQAEMNEDDVARGPRVDGVAEVNLPAP